jgi:hypothetical protein
MLRLNRGLIRVCGFFMCVGLLSLGLSLRNAGAQVEQRSQELGRRLLERLGPSMLGEPETLRINGQNLFIASSVTPLAPREVLDRLDRYCREHSGGLAEAITKLPSATRSKLFENLRDTSRWMTDKSSPDEDFAHIACFAREDQSSLAETAERLLSFAKTGNLASMGDFRYAVARRTANGKSHVLAIWTEGAFNLFEMFPEQGDAPGGDAHTAPRPPEAVRLLSAEARGQPFGVHLYQSAKKPNDVLRFYDREMHERGYESEAVWLQTEKDEKPTSTPSYARAFYKDGALLMLSALSEPVFGKGTQVSILELGTRGLSSAGRVAP